MAGQANWLSEWLGPKLKIKHGRDTDRFHIDSRFQVRNMLVDLKQGLQKHYAFEEDALILIVPEVAEIMKHEHLALLQSLRGVERMLNTFSPDSAELDQAVSQLLQAVLSQNMREENFFHGFKRVAGFVDTPVLLPTPTNV